MNRARARRAALVAVLAAAGVVGWRATRQSAPAATPVPPAAESSVRRDAALAASPGEVAAGQAPSAARPALPATKAPLPPHDVPLATVLDELERRARAGDAAAACRLALDGQLCRIDPGGGPMLEAVEQIVAARAETTARDVAMIADVEDDRLLARRRCDGLPPGWAQANTWRYMLQAALAGDAFLASQFASSPPLDRRAFLEQPEAWDFYRRHAATLLQRAAAQGEPRALWMLYRIHAGEDTLEGMPNAIVPDRRLAQVYARALQSLLDAGSRARLDEFLRGAREAAAPDAWQAVERDARRLLERDFAGVAPVDFSHGIYGMPDSSRCERTRPTASASASPW